LQHLLLHGGSNHIGIRIAHRGRETKRIGIAHYTNFIGAGSPRVKARTWRLPDSQIQKQKNHRRSRCFFPSAEMSFSPLRLFARVQISFPKSSTKNSAFSRSFSPNTKKLLTFALIRKGSNFSPILVRNAFFELQGSGSIFEKFTQKSPRLSSLQFKIF